MQEQEMEDGKTITTGRQLVKVIGSGNGLSDLMKIRAILGHLCDKVPEHIYDNWDRNHTKPRGDYHEEIDRILRLETVTYGDLQQLFELKPRRRSTPIGIHSEYNLRFQRKAYRTTFRGQAATRFVLYLSTVRSSWAQQGFTLYAQSVAILQSSGTGKSRLMTEVGKMVFTIPLCLRVSEHGWPAPDVPIRNWLKENPPTAVDAEAYYHMHFIFFLTVLLEFALDKLQSLSKGCQDREKLLSSWHAFFEDDGEGREKFYQGVALAAQKLQEVELRDDRLPTEASATKGQDYTQGDDSGTKVKFEPLLKPLIQRLLYPNLEALAKFIKKLRPTDGKSDPNTDSLIVAVFDEANALQGRFWPLQRVLSILDAVYGDMGLVNSFWSVFMATNSYVAHFTPIASEPDSLRIVEGTASLLPPYIALGFDQEARYREMTPKQHITMGEMEKLQWLAGYGRPLWAAYQDYDRLLELAAAKLINEQHENGNLNPKDPNQCLAVWSSRICLDPIVGSQKKATELTDTAVASHMRILLGTSFDRTFRYSHTPSEPILALGSARILHSPQNDAGHLAASLHTIRKMIGSVPIDKGNFGEIVGRLLTVLARDLSSDPPLQGLQRPVSLVTFLKTLLDGLHSKPNYKSLEVAFDTAVVNFTHWDITNESFHPDTSVEVLARMWQRHCALQCRPNQYSIDLIIAAYMGPAEESSPFCPERLTSVLLQLRFRNDLTPAISARTKIRAIARTNSLPYLGLVLDIGAEKATTLIEIHSPEVPLSDLGSCRQTLSQADLTVKQYQETVSDIQYGDGPKESLRETKKLLREARKDMVLASQNMDACGRYVIHIRTTKPFSPMLQKVQGLQDAFEAFLKAAKPPDFSSHNDPEVQSFMPWDRLLGHDASLLGNIPFPDNEDVNGEEAMNVD